MSNASLATSPNAPRVYSYIRFSSPEQALGNSLKRQLDDAAEFAAEVGLTLDNSLRMEDRGLSGFHGQHRKKGALGEFLKRIEAGEVPVGSILVVENIDRLGREDFLTAFETVSQILRHGITIQTLMPRVAYTRESLKGGLIYGLVGQMQLAHEESAKKSDRGLKNWKAKRKLAQTEGTLMTSSAPDWLEIADDRKSFTVNPAAAEAIRMVFDLKLSGLGVERIAVKLNAPGSPCKRDKGWHPSYVKKILKNRAVLGEYQPQTWNCGDRQPAGDPIPDYFPRIVEPDLFFAVQEQLKQNRGHAGRKDKVGNLFTGIATCGYCGGRMPFANKGGSPNVRTFLQCSNGQRGVCCKRRSMRYSEIESLVLENCQKLDPGQILPSADANASKVKSLRRLVQGKEAEIADLDRQSQNLVDRMPAVDGELFAALKSKFERIRSDREKLASEVKQIAAELRHVEQDASSVVAWQHGLKELQAAITKSDAVELRIRLREHLREFIENIEVFSDGWEYFYDGQKKENGGEDISEVIEGIVTDYVPALGRDPQLPVFAEYVQRRRMSKEGRFIRVHFKTGAVVNLVPEGSLASGMKMIATDKGKPTWKFVAPDIGQLWREFTSARVTNTTDLRRAALAVK